ncbi:MAG: hemolysin III family protein [Eubacteriales bacterium]
MQITIREPGSALTHFIGMLLTLIFAFPLLIKASTSLNPTTMISMIVFVLSMTLLYGASTTYHSVNASPKIIQLFRKIDHMMIFVLIAGSYTPICLVAFHNRMGYILLSIIWGIAFTGICVKGFWITCPKWFSSTIYILMGWICVAVFGQLYEAMSTLCFMYLLIGGIIYTIGGVIYALKLPLFNQKFKHFGSHELFHLFVMGGSICHFLCMYHLF